MTLDFLNSIKSNLRFQTYSQLVEDLYISSLLESFERLKEVPDVSKKTENEIRNCLAFDLENCNTKLLPLFQSKLLKLTKENTLLISPAETKRTDIEFFISGYGDFVVECKNLRSADQRYITEGANRFVNGVYASLEAEAALIGFVLGGSIGSIMLGLKTRLEAEESWDKDGTQSLALCAGYQFSFHSMHKRENKESIFLHHLFVNLVPKKAK